MNDTSIHPDTILGPVTLRVRDLQRSTEFYTERLGFKVMHHERLEVQLGTGDAHLLTLRESPGARSVTGTAGLYHFAVLVPSRIELARSLSRLVTSQTPLQGFADHLVSEAIYLADPDGNGIEIYRDRPRDQWPRNNGRLLMATDPLDVNGLLNEIANQDEKWTGLRSGTTIGHIHLQVSDLVRAVDFYQNVLGFDLILRYGPAAAFLSAGGYHHHVGLNTWAGTGIPASPEDATGLIHYEVKLPDQESFEQVAQRAKSHSSSYEQKDHGLLVHDPSGNGILLRFR